ncbi:AbrB/MazE/SpoVT family DNA-binding domain-containing protein [Sphingomonas sp. CJ20]
MNAPHKIEIGEVRSDGAIVIPQAMRDAMGLTVGGHCRLVMEDGRIAILPVELTPEEVARRTAQFDAALAAVAGKYPFGARTDDVIRDLRGDYTP